MILFKKFKIELSAFDAMALSDFLDLIGNKYDLGDDLSGSISHFISAVHDSGLKAFPNDSILLPIDFDMLGSNGTGKKRD